MSTPYPGGPRYDDQWPDVLDAEKWAELRALADEPTDPDVLRLAYRVAPYFGPRWPGDGAA